MKDSYIKGTGNSRNLKAAIPADITHEQLVQMLIAGTFPIDLNGINSEGWQQIGDALNKGFLFSDAAAQLFGLSGEHATPNEAFIKLAMPDGYYAYGVTVTVDGQPLSGVLVEGVKTFASLPAYTNADGYVLGMSNSSSVTLSIGGFADLKDFSRSYTAGSGVITNIAIEMQSKGITSCKITSSKTVKLSSLIKQIDIFCVGGGASGSASANYGEAAGGGSGRTKTEKDIDLEGTTILDIIIGAGGRSVQAYSSGSSYYKRVPGNDGGETSVQIRSGIIVSAPGGEGGHGPHNDIGGDGGSGGGSGKTDVDGNAGNGGVDGSDGNRNIPDIDPELASKGQGSTTRAFEETDGDLYSSAGGGAFARYKIDYTYGHAGYGAGNGVGRYVMSGSSPSVSAHNASVNGCGGGGAAIDLYHRVDQPCRATSGSGKGGIAIIRWRYAA